MRIFAAMVVTCLAMYGSVAAQDRLVRIAAPDALIDSGLMKHVLPRFKFKTQIVVEVAEPAEITFSTGPGTPVFSWQGETWTISPRPTEGWAGRFADWLLSDVGRNTITSYGDGAFAAPEAKKVEVAAVSFDGDVREGEELAHYHCGRCHVVSQRNRMGGIGSTPSFGAMKNFVDWREKFIAFYTLNPHPSFTQIETLTNPFDPARPPPIAPVEMSYADYEAILAYVDRLPVKDLGGAIISK